MSFNWQFDTMPMPIEYNDHNTSIEDFGCMPQHNYHRQHQDHLYRYQQEYHMSQHSSPPGYEDPEETYHASSLREQSENSDVIIAPQVPSMGNPASSPGAQGICSSDYANPAVAVMTPEGEPSEMAAASSPSPSLSSSVAHHLNAHQYMIMMDEAANQIRSLAIKTTLSSISPVPSSSASPNLHHHHYHHQQQPPSYAYHSYSHHTYHTHQEQQYLTPPIDIRGGRHYDTPSTIASSTGTRESLSPALSSFGPIADCSPGAESQLFIHYHQNHQNHQNHHSHSLQQLHRPRSSECLPPYDYPSPPHYQEQPPQEQVYEYYSAAPSTTTPSTFLAHPSDSNLRTNVNVGPGPNPTTTGVGLEVGLNMNMNLDMMVATYSPAALMAASTATAATAANPHILATSGIVDGEEEDSCYRMRAHSSPLPTSSIPPSSLFPFSVPIHGSSSPLPCSVSPLYSLVSSDYPSPSTSTSSLVPPHSTGSLLSTFSDSEQSVRRGGGGGGGGGGNRKPYKPYGSRKPRAEQSALSSTSSGSEPKLYACLYDGCKKTFSRPSNRNSHVTSHEVKRPYTCLLCEKSFARLHDRDRHALGHEPNKVYSCIVCQVQFARQDAVTRHFKLHDGINPCLLILAMKKIPIQDATSGHASRGILGDDWSIKALHEVLNEEIKRRKTPANLRIGGSSSSCSSGGATTGSVQQPVAVPMTVNPSTFTCGTSYSASTMAADAVKLVDWAVGLKGDLIATMNKKRAKDTTAAHSTTRSSLNDNRNGHRGRPQSTAESRTKDPESRTTRQRGY
ncbi:hypothetical protein BGW38_000976 [Lunasporangiospora selenospora]|uniref:C2H2-type domain-containing protein n=1 Tax=Lunasporangiospora selenospora TaxID=979761 RepID=A0A9P6FUX4_9FUNG|nr:hypothetical protein BGW38_000976 [Lunasporangiospora selenospora]